MQFIARWILHILPRALVFGSRLDLTWVLLLGAVFEAGSRAATQGTRCKQLPKFQVFRQLQSRLWCLFKGILEGKARLARTRDEPVK
jgi:hypothetical protein